MSGVWLLVLISCFFLCSVNPPCIIMDHPYNQILLFGDSITQFSFDPELQGFGASLANIYQRKVDVVNRGFSGSTH
ncbi:hypothetical protein BJV82DRAFT_399049 [Fennellomyces sp. T-0311]|nr:hypothetical protein BJV82DRAFT_399049 [Fennellomyces sp. T-0311]